MNDPDLKRLITGFLVLATAASSSVLMFSGFVSSEPTQAPALQVQTSTPYPVVGQNAFVETLSEAVELIEKPLTSPGVEPLNLTDAVTDVIVKELAAANPSGPELANGVLGANAPTPDAFFASADALFKDPRVVSELTA